MFLTRCQQDYVRFNAKQFEELRESDGGWMSFTMMATNDSERGVGDFTDRKVAVSEVAGDGFCRGHLSFLTTALLCAFNLT